VNLQESYLVARSVVRVVADSTRTGEIHRVEEITGRRSFERFLAANRHDPDVARLLRERPELDDQHLDFDALRVLSPGSLGREYMRHLDDNQLSALSQAAGTQHIDDPDMAYLMRRFRQTHDLWHALLALGVAGHEEVIIHAFSWGQCRLPVSAMVVFFGTIKHIVLEQRWSTLRHALLEAYRIGRDAAPLLPVYWEEQWSDPIDLVRARYRIEPCTPAWVHG
jgi:ubiquinone biosynthesis protein COQ4